MNMNKMMVVGRLADIIVYTEASGNVDARVWGRLIVNRGGRGSGFDVFPFVAWGKYADLLRDYSCKGQELGLEGKIRTTSKRRNDGSWDNRFELVCSDVRLGQKPADKNQKETPAQKLQKEKSEIEQKGREIGEQLAREYMQNGF
jgi:single-stranded DNA-binding protein